MTKYREILRLKSLGFSERNIAQSCGVSRNTVAKVLKKAAEIKLSWPPIYQKSHVNYSELLQLAKGWSNLVSNRIIIWRLRRLLFTDFSS